MGVREQAQAARQASYRLATLPTAVKDRALQAVAQVLEEHRSEILAENRKDQDEARRSGLKDALLKRLVLTEGKVAQMSESVREVVRLPDPVGRRLLARELDEGLVLTKVSVPLGVIGVIFESRPDALVQIASLGMKSGNAVILKGGSEALHSNRALFCPGPRGGRGGGARLPGRPAARGEPRGRARAARPGPPDRPADPAGLQRAGAEHPGEHPHPRARALRGGLPPVRGRRRRPGHGRGAGLRRQVPVPGGVQRHRDPAGPRAGRPGFPAPPGRPPVEGGAARRRAHPGDHPRPRGHRRGLARRVQRPDPLRPGRGLAGGGDRPRQHATAATTRTPSSPDTSRRPDASWPRWTPPP